MKTLKTELQKIDVSELKPGKRFDELELKKKKGLIDAALKGGRFATITFIKRDGTKRKMTCRSGVKKHLRGGSNTTGHIEKYVTVYDVQKKGYRNINLETVRQVRGNGQVYRLAR